MGKIIVNNIKGMGWKGKTGLIVMFTLVFSALIYQGWDQYRNVHAAVSRQANWAQQYAGTAFPNGTVNANYTVAAGQNRLLVVAISSTTTANSTKTISVTYGGQSLTLASGDSTVSRWNHTALYYLKEAGIQAATSNNLNVTVSGGTSYYNYVYAAVYANVDQNATYTSANYNNSSANSAVGPFSPTLAIGANDQAVEVINLARSSSGTTARTISTWATGWTTAGVAPTPITTSGPCATLYIRDRAIPTSATNDGSQHTASSTSTYDSMTAMSIKAATTTLGNGVAGTTGNVAPGYADQKIDGFSFVTSSTGTTDSVTGLTVTTTNNAAIASMKIMNEAGTTQYFSSVNNPGSDTWTFSGGTPLPVTGTAANYKILVTYKARAAAPAGNTATTARVSSYTCSNIQTTGTDTADTTLTLLNTHAASTWGTCTPGNAQVVLNWTKGTSTQSAIIIRYTANSDTTKPVDGTTYTVGTAFGSGGTVVYNGAASTYTNGSLTNGTTYYYKIFEYDALNYYYNATDVWTAGLTPLSPDAVPPTVDVGFAATTPVNTLAVPITSFSATDNVGGSGVAGYLITTSATKPGAGDAGWTSTPPATYTVAAAGTYTLYPWAKDGGGNVSNVYATPVTVVVDLAKPTVTTFTVASSQVATRNVPISAFTASDTGGSGVAAYMITTSSTPPAADNPGWLASAPATFTVAADGSYTLYPWAKDAAGNVSVVFGTPRIVLVDTTAPTGLILVSPADEATAQPQNTVLSCSTATDSGSGGVMYQFQITDENTYTQNSGWIAGTSYAPPALVKGDRYIWTVKAKDALGNETGWLTSRTFTVTAPCVRNDPTLILLTPAGGVSSTISTDSGTSVYNLRLINNDTGDCGSTTFNLSIIDTDLYVQFDDSIFNNGLTTKAVTLQPNSETTTTVTARATPGHDSGVEKTTVTSAADAYHAAVTTQFVQTTLNVVTCQPKTPFLIVGPDAGYLNKGGKIVYTITVKNTDAGAGCTPVTYTLSKASESNSTDFNASQISPTSLVLSSGELGSATLTVSAKSTAARNAVNLTAVHLAAAGHTSPVDVTITSTVNNPMLHNSANTLSTKWSVSGGWGIPNGRYGEIECSTCHVGGGGDTFNIKRMNEKIFTPYTSTHNHFPGEGKTIAYRRYVGTVKTQPVLGWDAGDTPRTNPPTTRICEACHTYDATGANGVKVHPYATTATLGNHYSSDGKDCTKCHKHNKGFGAGNLLCNSCHGDSSATEITAANRYAAAPPVAFSGNTGTLTGIGQVSNDSKVGAHQTHLRLFNGFNNYSSYDYRCQNCHGPVPTDTVHAQNGSSAPAFEGLATKRGSMSPTWNAASLTCTNTYCHNPAGTGGSLAAANAGFAIQPSWTSASYLTDTLRKSNNNCNRCHKVPGSAGFTFQSAHSQSTVEGYDCSGCHGHNGDATGAVGQRHMDGIRYAAGNCDSCHDYDTVGTTWGTVKNKNYGGFGEGNGAHAKHIAYLKYRWGALTLDPVADGNAGYGAGNSAKICGVCHTNNKNNHMTGGRMINFGDDTGTAVFGTSGQLIRVVIGTPALYNGDSATSSNTQLKTCSNLSCHYFTTPVWSTY